MSGNERTIFGNGDGTLDGRIVTDTDLNAISNNLTRRAWEVPGYADILAFDQMQAIVNGDENYDDVFTSQSPYTPYGRIAGVFTRGCGLEPHNAGPLGARLGAGVIGIWSQNAGAQTPPAQNGIGNMLWAWVGSGGGTSHDAATSGYGRWDLVTCSLSEVDATPVTRDFKDGTTGDVSSQSVVTSKIVTLSTLLVTKGAQANDGSESKPAIPTGQYALYAVHVLSSSIDKILDMTIPIGMLKKSLVQATSGSFFPAQWNVGIGEIVTTGSATGRTVLLYPPEIVSGNGEAKILGFRIAYNLAAGSTLKIGQMAGDGFTAWVDLDDLTGQVNCDGTKRSAMVDLRGPLASNYYGPYWGQGERTKGNMPLSTSIALRVTAADGATSYVYSVEWYTVG
jgi:hypothetical protein